MCRDDVGPTSHCASRRLPKLILPGEKPEEASPSASPRLECNKVPHAMSDYDDVFNPAGGSTDDAATMAADAIACVEAFSACFNARDLAGMDARLHFPHIILSGEKLMIWEKPGQLPSSFFPDLMASTGWDHSVYQKQQAILVSPHKVHLLVDYSRNRGDGSIITRHRNLWIVTEENGRWGIKQRSY